MGVISDALGRPAMVSGCAGALMAVIRNQMTDDGPLGHLCMYDRREYALFTMFLCGMLQMLCGALQISNLVKMIPQPAFIGFFLWIGDLFRGTPDNASELPLCFFMSLWAMLFGHFWRQP